MAGSNGRRWVVPDRLTVTAVGGQVILDMREALLQGMHTVLNATLIGGQLHLVVPERVQVTLTKSRQPGRVQPAARVRGAARRPNTASWSIVISTKPVFAKQG